jgi:hypothetical protein
VSADLTLQTEIRSEKRIERNTGSRCKDAREKKGERPLIVFEIDHDS